MVDNYVRQSTYFQYFFMKATKCGLARSRAIRPKACETVLWTQNEPNERERDYIYKKLSLVWFG